MASLEGNNLVVFYYLSVSKIWSDKRGHLIRRVASHEGNNLVVFYYLSVSKIWSDKRGHLIRGGSLS